MLNWKDSLKSVVFIIAGSMIFCWLFIANDPGQTTASGNWEGKPAGRVLGVSERQSPKPAKKAEKEPGQSLPASQDKPAPEPPKLKQAAAELSLGECESAVLLDAATGESIFAKSADSRSSIASITKLATALVFMRTDPDWQEVYQVQAQDLVSGGRVYLQPGDKVELEDLFHLSLVGSANSATRALVSATGLEKQDFVARMNELAGRLGLEQTKFADPVGLGTGNLSTASELAVLVKKALQKPVIRQAVMTRQYSFRTKSGRQVSVFNTDRLLKHYPSSGIRLLGGKTGYTRAAGYCFAGKFSDEQGNAVVSVVLGGDEFTSRFTQTEKMVQWAYDSYQWK